MTNIRNALMQAAGSASGDPVYVEDVFSIDLYTGNNSAQTITNGLDLSGEGGLVWAKQRGYAESHTLLDTERGATKILSTNATDLEMTIDGGFDAFTSTGFTLKADNGWNINKASRKSVAWSFRKQKGFFDVVKFSTTGGGGTQAISHNLGSIPGFIILKKTSASQSWLTFHKGVTSPNSNWWRNWSDLTTAAFDDYFSDDSAINSAPTSTTVTVGSYFTDQTADFIMYVFAEGGSGDQIFGDDGDKAIIKCGTFSSATEINLGFEPQWMLVRRYSSTGNWYMINNMTGFFGSTKNTPRLVADLNIAEGDDQIASVTATGFNSRLYEGSGDYMYMAIRRGPMKEPSAGTDVYTPVRPSASGTFTAVSGFPTDLTINKGPSNGDTTYLGNRLTDVNSLAPTSGAAAFSVNFAFDFMNQITIGGTGDYSAWISWNFRRYPKVFDAVVYTGTGSNTTYAHNLGVVPEMMIIKQTSNSDYGWFVYESNGGKDKYMFLNGVDQQNTSSNIFGNTPTATAIVANPTNNYINASTETHLALLFASLAGISKVGTYTGTGNTLDVDCGFSGGARFVMIKRTDANDDWYVYDTVTGIISSNEAYNFMNSNTGVQNVDDFIDPHSSGFTITSTAPDGLNASGGTYLFLAFA